MGRGNPCVRGPGRRSPPDGRLWARVRKNKESATSHMTKVGCDIPRGSLWNRPCSLVPARSTRRPIRQCSVRSATRHRIGGTGTDAAHWKKAGRTPGGRSPTHTSGFDFPANYGGR